MFVAEGRNPKPSALIWDAAATDRMAAVTGCPPTWYKTFLEA